MAGVHRLLERLLGDRAGGVLDVRGCKAVSGLHERVDIDAIVGEIALPKSLSGNGVGCPDGQDVVETAMPQECGVEYPHRVGSTDEQPARPFAEGHQRLEKLVDDGDRGCARSAGRSDLLDLIDEHQHVLEFGEMSEHLVQPAGKTGLGGRQPRREEFDEWPAESTRDGAGEGRFAGARRPEEHHSAGWAHAVFGRDLGM